MVLADEQLGEAADEKEAATPPAECRISRLTGGQGVQSLAECMRDGDLGLLLYQVKEFVEQVGHQVLFLPASYSALDPALSQGGGSTRCCCNPHRPPFIVEGL